METAEFGIGQVEGKVYCNDFSHSFQIDAVKNEPGCSETDLVVHERAADDYQDQNEGNLDAKNLSREDLGHSEFFDNSSTGTFSTVGIKNDIDIVYEDIKPKTETREVKPSEHITFCQVCYQSVGEKADILKPTIDRSECSCQNTQKQTEFLYNISQDITLDVKPFHLDHIADLEWKPLTVQGETSTVLFGETVSGNEVIKEQDSPAIPWRPSVSSIERDHRMKSKFCSKPRNNNVSVSQKKFQCKSCSKSFSCKSKLRSHERVHAGEKPFHCKVCSKSFILIEHLKLHERRHTGDKPFFCKICSKSFSEKRTLRYHERGFSLVKNHSIAIFAQNRSLERII